MMGQFVDERHARAERLMPVVERIAKSFARRLPRWICLDDLIGAGNLGLADALNKRPDADEQAFQAYAINRIRGEIIDELRRLDPLSRDQRAAVRSAERAERALNARGEPLSVDAVAAEAGMSRARYSETRALRLVSVQESLEAIDGRVAMAEGNRGDLAMEQQVHTSHAWSLVEGQLETLAPKLRTTIVGISCGKTLKQLGQQLGVTEARVCQLRQQAIRQLRLRCAERGLPMSVAA